MEQTCVLQTYISDFINKPNGVHFSGGDSISDYRKSVWLSPQKHSVILLHLTNKVT